MSLGAKLSHTLAYGALGVPLLRYERWQNTRKLRAYRPKSDDPLEAPLVANAWVKEIMSRHYLSGRYASGAKKVAYVTSGAPIEVLRALGFHLVYPENHAALCGARRATESLATVAEEAGYSRDLCSYARSDIGTALSGKTPVGKLPRPDLLVACTNICQTVLYWYRVLAAELDVPLYVIDTPFLYGEAQPHQLAYVQRQIEELVPVAEKVAGKKLSPSRLEEVIAHSKEASELWLEVLGRAKARPAPLSAFDAFVLMAPVVDLRGEQVTIDFYRAVLRELDGRIARGEGAIKNERMRIVWDNLPIWPRMRRLSRFFAQRGVAMVAATYTHAWGELAPMIDPSRPFESAAKVYLHPILNRSAGHKLESIRHLVGDFEADGVVLHSDRSCKPYSLGQLGQRDRLVDGVGVPALLLEADHADPRTLSDEQIEGRLEAFIETMEAAR